MPSGHATTSVAGRDRDRRDLAAQRALRCGLYALVIMFSRVVVLAHHPSDVIAGALTGAAGAYLVRRWFAARRLVFRARDLRSFPGPSWRRIVAALARGCGKNRPH